MVKIPADADILPPADDHIFKAILTNPNGEGALKGLISALLEREVVTVQIRNNELPVTDDAEKAERLDVNCIIDGGDQVDVEMQVSRRVEQTDDEYRSFINKSIYYLTDLHSSQKSKRVKYRDLVRTYQVTFCVHPVFPKWPDFISRVTLRRPNGEQISDQINMMIIELSKLNEIRNKSVEDMTVLEDWSVFFRFAPEPEYRDLINSVINKNKEVCMAAELLMEISKDEHERARQRSRRMYETDMYSDLATAEARGEIRGEARGLTKGREEGREEILALIQKGVSLDDILKTFGTT